MRCPLFLALAWTLLLPSCGGATLDASGSPDGLATDADASAAPGQNGDAAPGQSDGTVPGPPPSVPGQGPDAAVIPPPPAPDAAPARDATPPPTPDAAVIPDPASNAATFVDQTVPDHMEAGRAFSVRITFRNTGTVPWSRATGFYLGMTDADGHIDDQTWGTNRGFMDDGATTAPGETYTFAVTVTAPADAGTYTLRTQMLQDGVEWFGDLSPATAITVDDAAPPDQPPFDLNAVTIEGSPDVRGWPITSDLTDIEFHPGVFHIDHSLRGQWPPVVIDPDGTEQEATVWVFFAIDGVWYGTGGERLRPGQNEKQLDHASDIGPGWLYDANRWGPMTGYIPRPGELVGFMVAAGSTRSDDNVAVQERTNIVLIPFPVDGVDATYPPFAWSETAQP